MSMKQINTLFRFETDKEQKAIRQLQNAEHDYQENLLRLQSVSDYRLEYMKRLNQRTLEGLNSATFRHFHAFVAKLDNAAEQVEIAIRQSKSLVEKCKKEWLVQRQKVQAVESLRDKKLSVLKIKADKAEQNMFDEIATQQFVRRHM